ncbi:MAG: hypothetical protein L0Z47_01670, partial [Actinobacteria bacterium]|nr:hypothetical protein [Actinomycetota bacterium]
MTDTLQASQPQISTSAHTVNWRRVLAWGGLIAAVVALQVAFVANEFPAHWDTLISAPVDRF